jgi:hypothetical protein
LPGAGRPASEEAPGSHPAKEIPFVFKKLSLSLRKFLFW